MRNKQVVFLLTLVSLSVGLVPQSAMALRGKKDPVKTDATPIPLPKFYARHVEEGNKLLAQNRITEAMNEFFTAKTINPVYYPTYIGLGKAYQKMGQLEKATQQYQIAVHHLNPSYAADHVKRAEYFASRRMFKQALGDYWEVLKIDPQAGNQYTLAMRHLRFNNEKDATKAFERASQIDEDYPDPHFQLANLFLKNKKVKKAIPEYEKAVSLDPNNPLYHVSLGNALYKEGTAKAAKVDVRRVEQAVTHFERAIGLGMRQARVHFNLGTAYLLVGNYDGAIANLQETLQRELRDEDVYYNLGNAFYKKAMTINFKWDQHSSLTDPQQLKMNDTKFEYIYRSIQSYQMAVAKKQNYAPVYFDLGVSYYRLAELKPTAQFISKIVNKETSKEYFTRGMRYFKMDMHQRSLDNFQRFTSLSSDSKLKGVANQLITDIKELLSEAK
jgi:tetratricopeptide (TPR) repeat protein